MNKPYIICHMMTSVDGRIDCAMTSQLPGVEDYYKTLDGLNVPTTVSGRVTAELEVAEPGFFEAKNSETYTQEGFSKKADAKGYEIIVDTKGKLLWPDASDMDNQEHPNYRGLFSFLLSGIMLLCKLPHILPPDGTHYLYHWSRRVDLHSHRSSGMVSLPFPTSSVVHPSIF